MNFCIDICVLLHVYVHGHSIEVKGQSWMSSLVTLNMIILRQSLSLTLEVTNLATLARQHAPVTFYFHLLNCWGYEHA